MKKQAMAWIGVIVIVGLASYWLGGLKPSREAYALQLFSLTDDRVLLADLRAGDTTNAISKLEFMLDMEVLRAMRYRSSLPGKYRPMLDKRLASIANYREKFPRQTVGTVGYTNNLYAPAEFQRLERQWATNSEQIDAFLHSFAKQ